ncbi:hypothetical protein CTI12_AA331100 [Artemisia annua]|uniref:Splicing factor Cactin C-terminal domain-containing protein n=1 Tax=Artemisia annua TaxID=35608 RepID=A0A2U1LNE5_ARTAN|nr:hypothetical protein CTI12_AA331100 [Artemisia annua]
MTGCLDNISDEKIVQYLAKKAIKRVTKAANNESNDSNPFVWKKKIEQEVTHGVPLDTFSVKSEKMKLKERMIEFEKLRKRREERVIEKRKHDEEMELLARDRARAEHDQWEQKLEEFHTKQDKYRTNIIESHEENIEENMGMDSLSSLSNECNDFGVRKPKYINHVHTGYNWNSYNRIHYDKENPPPKMVTGYKFDVFYPDLIDGNIPPSYTIEKDGNSVETCIIRFHGGLPYQDIAFKIVNNEWELSRKKGFKCVFEQGILRLYFNFKSFRYRR